MSEHLSPDPGFAEVAQMIASARQRAFQSVNTQLIDLYWQVGEYISRKIERAEWGDGVVNQLADHLARTQPGLRASRAATCSGCDSSTKPIAAMRKCHHW